MKERFGRILVISINADFLFYLIWGVTLIIAFRSGHQSQGNLLF